MPVGVTIIIFCNHGRNGPDMRCLLWLLYVQAGAFLPDRVDWRGTSRTCDAFSGAMVSTGLPIARFSGFRQIARSDPS